MLDLEKRREGAPEPEAPADAFAPINIMCDPRVYRGTAFGKNSFKSSSSSAAASPGTPADLKDRTIKNRRVSRQARLPSIAELHQSIHVVLPHEDVPLRVHLEERLAPPVVHRTQTTQTDAFPDRPADPGYVPAKIGMDTGTQIADGDLFDLDEAMAPIVSVLVSKTLQQALIEVQMETELSVIAERKRDANLTEALRLEQIAEQEANARADAAKAARLLENERERVRRERRVIELTLSRRLACSTLANLSDALRDRLALTGFFYDSAQRQVEEHFLPWITERVQERVADQFAVVARLVADVVDDAVRRGRRDWSQERQAADDERRRLVEERRRRERVVNLHLRLMALEGRIVGPVPVRNEQTIGAVQDAIRQWLQANAADVAEQYEEAPMQVLLDGAQLDTAQRVMDLGIETGATLDLAFSAP
ncbi:Ubiquitin-like domain-containing protein [Plasmodiophora brassicae]